MQRTLGSSPLVWLGIIVTTCLLLVLFQSVLWLVVPILLAVVSYYTLSPLVHMAMEHGLTRSRSVLIVTAMLCVFIIALGAIVYPKIVVAKHGWRDHVTEYVNSGANLAAKARKTLMEYMPFPHAAAAAPVTPAAPPSSVTFTSVTVPTPAPAPDDAFRDSIAAMLSNSSGNIALELLHWIPSLLLVPYLTYFFLLEGPRFKRFLVQAIPNAYFEKALYLLYRVEDQIRRYFQGLLALTLLDGACLGVGLWILGLPGPFFLATVAAILAWLPYLGSITGCLMVVLVAAHHAPNLPYLPYEAVALFLGVRLLDDFVFLPLTIGRSLRLHPVVAVLMILLGGAVAGIAGLLLVMPVLGVVMVAGQLIGELASDPRLLARHRYAKQLRRERAQVDL